MQIIENDLIYRLFFFLLGVISLGLWQKSRPLVAIKNPLSRWRDHLALLGLSHFFVKLFLPTITWILAGYLENDEYGLLNMISMPPVIKTLLAVVLLDLVIYWQHRLFHLVPLLWRLHRVHHIDTQMDITTGFRFHPLEIFLSLIIKLVFVALLGIDVVSLLIFEILLNLFSLFTHANISLFEKAEHLLKYLIVTPPMHRIHHSVIKNETNSNYGFMLSLWDKIFSSYKEKSAMENLSIELGINEFKKPHQQRFLSLLKNPFL